MSVLTNVLPTTQSRIRRKPAPSLELDARYPRPDPDDPFAPLSVLRSRTASTLGAVDPTPLTFRGTSTSHLPTLPYTGGRYPPDIYQAYLHPQPTSAVSSGFEQPWDKSAGGPPWLPPSSPVDFADPLPRVSPQRRRSQSAVSRNEARMVSSSPRSSPYGYGNLHSYVLASARSSTPALAPAFSTGLQSKIPESAVRHGNEIVHSLVSPHAVGGIMSMPSSQVHLPVSLEDGLPSSRKGGKFTRFLPKRAVGRLSQGHKSTDSLARPVHGHSILPFPPRSNGRSSKGKQLPEESTFHTRRKSSALFPAAVAANLHAIDVSSPVRATGGALMYEPLTDADLGYLNDSRIPLSRPPTSDHVPADPVVPRNVHARSQTMDGCLRGTSRHVRDGSDAPQLPSVLLPPYSDFDEHALPTPKQLTDAASCVVIAENGVRVPFGDLFKEQKTIVIFIRHFWCPLCQDYMFSLSSAVDLKLLKQADVNLVVVGNGSFNMIKSYRQIFRTPFAVYTDPSMRLHNALGMTSLQKTGPKSQTKRGGYIRHGKVNGLAMVVANALRVGMPIWEKGGDPSQLGGEFVFGPGLTVTFAHRMPNAGCHAPILRVLAAAGVNMSCEVHLPTREPSERPSVLEENRGHWMEERRLSLARIRERKIARRMGIDFPACATGHPVSSLSSPTGYPLSPLSQPSSTNSDQLEGGETACRGDDSDDTVVVVSAGDSDTEIVSGGSQTLTDFDYDSDHTRNEEVEPHDLGEKVVLLHLEDFGTPPGLTVSS